MDNYNPNNWSDNNNTNQNQNINGNQHPNQNYFNNDYPVPPAKPKDKLATFSLILAIAGCVTSIVYYISLPCTISAIVLAILSRSRIGRFEGQAVARFMSWHFRHCFNVIFLCYDAFHSA